MHHDDTPRGRLLTRKEALAIFGGAAVAMLGVAPRARAASTGCIARPALGEGPYYLHESLLRADITTDPATGLLRPGRPLQVTFQVSRLAPEGCQPLPGAIVELWHCDAAGVYSGVGDAEGQMFLRGHQVADADGRVQFNTIYPGWYPGRAVHIHFKVRPDKDSRHEFTSQLFFEDALSDRVYASAPYKARGEGKQRNEDDAMFREHGKELLLNVTETGEERLAGAFDLALDLGGLG